MAISYVEVTTSNTKVDCTILPPFSKDLPTYCSYRYQGKSSCVGYGVSKVGERKGLIINKQIKRG